MDDTDRTFHINEILDVVEDFATASAGLVAWELMTDEATIIELWNRALDAGLLLHAGVDEYGEDMYELTPIGHEQLTEGPRVYDLCPC